jgi:hypothetical protein
MRTSTRVASIASCTALAAMLSACGVNPTLPASVPVSTYPAALPATTLEYGRITNIVPTTGDLRIGDRVRVENGVIYRS